MPIILSCYRHGKPTSTFKWLVLYLEQSSTYCRTYARKKHVNSCLIDERLSELPEGASQRRRLSKIGNTMLTHRLLSAQEAAFRLCHLPLKGASRTTQYVSTERPSRRMSQLQNGLGWIRKRTFSACLRVPHKTPEAHGDDYYYHLLLLYLPWRDEESDLLSGYANPSLHSWVVTVNCVTVVIPGIMTLLMNCNSSGN